MTTENSAARMLPVLATAMTALFLVGWFFCVGTGSFVGSWLGLSTKVWFAMAMTLHLATLILSAVIVFVAPQAPASVVVAGSRGLLATLIGSLVFSAILLVGLIRFEPQGGLEMEMEQDSPGSSTGYHISNPGI